MGRLLHVLMVEDSEPDATLILRELEQGCFDVRSQRVETEADFLAAIAAQPWDLILCDYSMPEFNGLTALRLFKERDLDIPFIFVSGTISEDTAVGSMKSGAQDYVMKTNLKRLAPAVVRELNEAGERREKRRLQEETLRIQQELRKKDELFRSLIEHSSGGVSLVDLNGAIVYESPSVSRILGHGTESRQRQGFFGFVHPEDFERTKESFNDLASSPGKVTVIELRFKHEDGTWHWVETIGHNMLDDEKVAAIVVNYRDITERKNAEAELKANQDQLRALTAGLQSAREEERKNIAREFHDQLGQFLTALNFDLTLLHREIADNAKELHRPKLERQIGVMQQEIARATKSVREILSELRPELLDQLGIVEALSWETERFEKRSGIPCTFSSDVEELELAQEASMALFRIFQEAMTNVIRHSGATRVEVGLHVEAGSVQLQISDNGVGIESNAEEKIDSLGLIGMRERALLLGGSFEVEGIKGLGTRVKVVIPLRSAKLQRGDHR